MFEPICRGMTSLQDLDLLFPDVLTSILTTSFREAVSIISSALFDTSSDLTTTFFTVLLMVLMTTMARMVLQGRTVPVVELEKYQWKFFLYFLKIRSNVSFCV